MGIQINGLTDTISASDGSLTVSGTDFTDVTNISVTGVSTFSTGPVFIGSATSTGTASQSLQVTGSAYISDNLGIGVTNPGAKLDVAGDIRLSAADAEIEFNTGGVRLKGRTNALSIHTGGGLDTETSERVRINNTGVGIGTSNPTVALQLSPTASISNVGTGITLPGTIGAALTVAQFLYGNSNASYLRIKATRNEAGSSWTSASTKLVQVTDVTEQSYIDFNPIGSWSGGGTGLGFGGASGEWARFNISGNLGIGTTNPTYKTHIVDTAATGAGLLVQGGGQGSPIARFERTVGGSGLLVDVNASGGDPQIVFHRVGVTTFAIGLNQSTGTGDVFEIASSGALGTNTRFVIDSSNGSVGIGTTNPQTALDLKQKTDAIALPQGTTAQRPGGNAPYIRYNTTNTALEFYNGTDWVEIISDYFPTGSVILG